MTGSSVRTIDAPELGDRVILAIDTSLGTSVAIGADARVTEVSSDDPRGHAEVIGTLIERAFAERGIDPASVTHVAAGMGPGPFTGLRVGIAAANAFALGRGLATLPLVSHDAAALELLESGATAGVRIVQDAKRRELFVTDYTSLDWAGIPERAGEPHLAPRAGLRERLERALAGTAAGSGARAARRAPARRRSRFGPGACAVPSDCPT